jgi:hypothetical protein
MPRYCVHLLDSSGKVIGVGQFDCINSQTAQERIKQLAGDLDSELWQLVSPSESGTKPNSEANQPKPSTRRRLHS